MGPDQITSVSPISLPSRHATRFWLAQLRWPSAQFASILEARPRDETKLDDTKSWARARIAVLRDNDDDVLRDEDRIFGGQVLINQLSSQDRLRPARK